LFDQLKYPLLNAHQDKKFQVRSIGYGAGWAICSDRELSQPCLPCSHAYHHVLSIEIEATVKTPAACSAE
jgi:hypothetical protein